MSLIIILSVIGVLIVLGIVGFIFMYYGWKHFKKSLTQSGLSKNGVQKEVHIPRLNDWIIRTVVFGITIMIGISLASLITKSFNNATVTSTTVSNDTKLVSSTINSAVQNITTTATQQLGLVNSFIPMLLLFGVTFTAVILFSASGLNKTFFVFMFGIIPIFFGMGILTSVILIIGG